MNYNEKTTLKVDYYSDYKLKNTQEWKGTYAEVFDRYNDANDMLKYCNGSYYRFHDDSIVTAFSDYVSSRGGVNYLISQAVKRGCLID